ncbi:hypothetical protein ACFSL5_19390, partial [Ottowia pentelensis]|uniref:hypothetical protein n=1 Tax=Ottowia pentelensis TaxID=511108 RepID=UPI00363BD54E
PALRNQRLAAMFGEDMIGNQNAEAAYNLRNRIALLERYSDPTAGDGSLGLLKKELERLTAAMEADRAAKQKSDRPGPAPAAPERSSGGARAPAASAPAWPAWCGWSCRAASATTWTPPRPPGATS